MEKSGFEKKKLTIIFSFTEGRGRMKFLPKTSKTKTKTWLRIRTVWGEVGAVKFTIYD